VHQGEDQRREVEEVALFMQQGVVVSLAKVKGTLLRGLVLVYLPEVGKHQHLKMASKDLGTSSCLHSMPL
jgi:hypothetical protein